MNKRKIILEKLTKFIKNPIDYLKIYSNRICNLFRRKIFATEFTDKSESDSGLYLNSVNRAIYNYSKFKVFKRDRNYNSVLEHVSQTMGEEYLKEIKAIDPKIYSLIDSFKINDIYGKPLTYQYGKLGHISPSTLRYIKVACDIKRIFNGNIGSKVVEIGVGYGGQTLINDLVFKDLQFYLIDLPPVLALTTKYLECHTLNSSYKTLTLNQIQNDCNFDLAISNYAFSELPKFLQIKYIDKVLKRSKRGYLTMNSGYDDSVYRINKLNIHELRDMLPDFTILPEIPLTAKNNYIIVWGNN